MFSSAYQTVLRFVRNNRDEFIFAGLFISTVTANKYILSELHFTVPTVFQGWHTLSCVLLLTALVKFEKCPKKITTLDKKSLYLTLPGFACFAVSLVAGSKGLAELKLGFFRPYTRSSSIYVEDFSIILMTRSRSTPKPVPLLEPVPVFCAILSLYPAILILSDRKTDFWENSKQVCGSATICGTVVVILVMTLNPFNTKAYMSLLAHVVLSVIYTLYMKWINVDLSSTAKIYYRNLFSVIVLFPVSVYLDVLDLPRYFYWEFYLGCILSGVLGTFMQIATSEIESKGSYMNYQGRARLICSVIGHYLFFQNVEPVIWMIILVNLIANSILLSSDEKDLEYEKRSKLTFIVGSPHMRDLDIEKTIFVHLESQRTRPESECNERLIVNV